MPDIRFDTYYRYDDLSRLLRAFADEYPNLVRVESVGKSHEGRDIWLATVTNFETGADNEKPALWADGNIHATEVSASSACLYLLHKLTTQYGYDEHITRCLDTRVFYVCPRVSPDGAEWALEDTPRVIRSSTRPYPYDEETIDGLRVEDIDGDGRILQMRIPDTNGAWKPHPDEPRLLIRREPVETGGTYYRLLPEGRIENYDGVTINVQPKKERLDLNRNFPAHWRTEGEQGGAGPYPTSEPEIRSIVDFIANHTNITGALTFHTFSGVLLRPYSHAADDEFPTEDLWTYQKIGAKGTEITGYPNISVYHDFKYHPKESITGVFDDWMFDHRGVFAWTVEIWSPQRQAGITDYKYIDWFREHPVEDDLKLIRWNDEVLDGKGHVDWVEYDHPEFGKVELGGWDHLYAWRNPPPQFLEKEIAPLADWMVWHLLISPKLELFSARATPLGDGSYRIEFVVHNTGWLPTNVTTQAINRKAVRGVVFELELPKRASFVVGKARETRGQIEGKAHKPSAPTAWGGSDSTDDRLKIEWVVNAPNGGDVTLIARHERAGTVRTTLNLG
ncbi:MAG: M14 family metallopeptidase [Candidatus Poribacteria bacterium]|nr:M14 family metallopeptidase [Candidatus Poribacteria bacterium]